MCLDEKRVDLIMQGIDIAFSKLIGCTCFQRDVALEIMEKPSIGTIKQGIGRCLSGKALKGCYFARVVFSMSNFLIKDEYLSQWITTF
jgi:hypothetical protein